MPLHASLAASVTPATLKRVVPDDPDDDHVIAAAVTANADLNISGDQDLLKLGSYGAIRIVSPATALSLLASK